MLKKEGLVERQVLFFGPTKISLAALMGLQKKEETSKQTPDFVRHCIVFACLGEPKASQRDAQGEAQARKDKQALGLRPSFHQCLLVFIWDSWYIKVSLTKEKTQWKKLK